MKNKDYETVEFLHMIWEDYSTKHDINKDIEALIKLVENNTGIARNETEVLATVYDSALVVLDSSKNIDEEEKTRASYFSYSLYSDETNKPDFGANINKKGQILLAHNYFLETLNQKSSPAFGVLELMYTIIHALLHGIFPDLNEKAITEKTEEVWKSGMEEFVKH